VVSPAPDFEAIARDYGTAIEAGSYADAAAVVQRALAAGASGSQVFTRVLTPAMYRIGERWERAEITVADEHLATAITNRAMGLVYEALAVEIPTSKERVLITAVEGDQHVMGLQMIADILEGAGYQTLYLGADTPLDGLIAAIARHEPTVVAIGGTAPWSVSKLVETMRAIRALNPALPVVLGGAQARRAALTFADDLTFVVADAESVVDVVAAAVARARREALR
jgi:methanogenic corrinoid protein MtbC1